MAENLSKTYEIDKGSYNLFDNITRLMKHATLKDSRTLDSYENALSIKFSNYLIKYFEYGLSPKDIANLLMDINNYNKEIATKFWTDDVILERVYGYKKYEDKYGNIIGKFLSNSLATKLADTYADTVISALKQSLKYPEDITVSFDPNLVKMIRDNAFLLIDESSPASLNFGITDNSFNEFQYHVIIDNESKTVNVTTKKNEKDPSFELTNADKTDGINIEFKKTAQEYENALKSRESIQVFASSNVGANVVKNAASSTEMTLADGGFPYCFFDLRGIKFTKEDFGLTGNEALSQEFLDAFGITPYGTERTNAEYNYELNSICIMYKEFNPEYRRILDQDYCEVGFEFVKNKAIDIKRNESFTASIEQLVRNTEDAKGLVIKSGYSSNKFRYLRGNPYTARRANESSLIAYYYGDNYAELSNGYGTYQYQVKEARKFADIFEETRQYYYTVLLNKAFINEKDYPLFERFFITAVSIMRMIDSKVSTSKDIDEFDRTDVNNFLTSFGLKNFTTSATRDEFMNQEQYLKRIIKNYGALKQQKGSRDVIDTILNIFNYGDRSVDVNKYMLYESEFEKAPEEIKNKDAAKTKKSKLLKKSNSEDADKKYKLPKNSKKSIKFIEAKYDTENSTNNIEKAALTSSESYDSFLNGTDKYWDPVKVPEETVSQLNISTAETKYLSLKVTEDSYKIYIRSRYLLSLVDYFDYVFNNYYNEPDHKNEANKTAASNIVYSVGDGTLDDIMEISLLDMFKVIKYLFNEFLKTYNANITISSGTYYGINKVNAYTDFKEHKNYIAENYLYSGIAADDIRNKFYTNNTTLFKVVDGKYTIPEDTYIQFNDLRTSYDDESQTLDDMISRSFDYISPGYICGKYADNAKAVFDEVLENALEFPMNYMTGEFIKTSDNYDFNRRFEVCVSKLFERYYTCGEDPLAINGDLDDDLVGKFGAFLENNSEGYFTVSGNKLIGNVESHRVEGQKTIPELINAFASVFNSAYSSDKYPKLGFSIDNNQNKEVAFISSAVSQFISYTAQLRDASFNKSVRSEFENASVSDGIIKKTIKQSKSDSVFYDERAWFTTRQGGRYGE